MGNYRRVVMDIEDNVRSNLEQVLPYSDLIDIRVSRDYDWGSGVPYLSVKISYDLNKTKNQSLAWSYSVGLDRDGNIKKESNSWSGLNAVTQEQLDDLEKSIEILKKLNIIDWESIVKTDVPSVGDYVTTKTLPEKDFTFEQFNADLEDFGSTCTCGDCMLSECCSDFKKIKPTSKVLQKYRISCSQFYQICDELKEKLHVEYCGWCS